MKEDKSNIRNYSFDELNLFCSSIGEKTFRAKQIFEWIWKKGVCDFDKMLNLSKDLRIKLSESFYFDSISIAEKMTSNDKTTKILFESIDKQSFEGVLIPSKDRVTACISTQAGCPLDCSFCATGKLGFNRNLSKGD